MFNSLGKFGGFDSGALLIFCSEAASFLPLDQGRVQGLRRASFDETFAMPGKYQDLPNHLEIAAGLAQTGAVSE